MMTAIMTTLMPFYVEIMTAFCTENMTNNGMTSYYPGMSGNAVLLSEFCLLVNLFVLYRPIGNRSALGENTLLLFSGICTGCLSDAVSSSHWRRSCSRRWTAWHRLIWRMIVILSLVSYSGRLLRSSDNVTCSAPRTRTLLGDADRSFAVAGPRVWKSLPAPIRTVDRLSIPSRDC